MSDINTPPLKQLISDFVRVELPGWLATFAIICLFLLATLGALAPKPEAQGAYTHTYHDYKEQCINGVVYYERGVAYFPALRPGGEPYTCGGGS